MHHDFADRHLALAAHDPAQFACANGLMLRIDDENFPEFCGQVLVIAQIIDELTNGHMFRHRDQFALHDTASGLVGIRQSIFNDGDINEPISESYKARVRWLIANLGTAMVASFIIAQFGAAIETMVALAVLMPIVASIGGNAGTQTLAVTVRALATNQLTQSNTMRSIWREIRVALLIGATIAVIAGLGAGVIFGNWLLASVIAVAILCNISLAGLSGVAIPVLLDRLDQDPAVSSSIFVTMITDSMGFLIFLGLAVFSGLAG